MLHSGRKKRPALYFLKFTVEIYNCKIRSLFVYSNFLSLKKQPTRTAWKKILPKFPNILRRIQSNIFNNIINSFMWLAAFLTNSLEHLIIRLIVMIEIEARERVWTPNFSFKKPIECGLLWSEPWCAVSNVQAQFSVSGLMRAICLYLKISINLHENSKLTMLFWLWFMLIISFDWQEKIGNSRGETCKDIFISCKSPTWRPG